MSPWFSYIRNIGFDGSGTNCELKRSKVQQLNHYGKFTGRDNYQEDKEALKIMKKAYNRSLIKKIIFGSLKTILGKNVYNNLKKIIRKFNYAISKLFIRE